MISRKLLPLFLIVAVDVLGLTIVIPLLPFYAEKYGASPFVASLIVTVYAFCQLISGPILGKWSDRVGRRPVLLASQIGTFIGFLILGYANSLWMIFVGRIIDGITAGNLSVAQAAISDLTEAKDRAKSFAIIGIAFGIGFLIGPAISGFLSRFGYHAPFFAAAGLSFLSILGTYFLLPRHQPPAPTYARAGIFDVKSYSRYFSDERLAPLLTQFFLFALAFSFFMSGFALFAERRFDWNGIPFGPEEVGYLYAFAGLLGILVQGGMLGRLVSRYGERRLSILGFLTATVGYGALAFARDLEVLIPSIMVFSLGHAVLRPTITSLISQQADRDNQGAVMGTTQSLYSFAQVLGPIIGGLLIDRGWLGAWALSAAALTLGGGFLALGTSRKMVAQKVPSTF